MKDRREINRRYNASAKGRARQKRYLLSDKGRAAVQRYEQTEEAKARHRRYSNSDKGKTRRRRWRSTDFGKEFHRVSMRLFRAGLPISKKELQKWMDQGLVSEEQFLRLVGHK